MNLNFALASGLLTCRLTGSFRFSACDDFAEVLARMLAPSVRGAVLDLAGLTGMDTAAVWMMSVVREEAARMGLSFAVTGARGLVRDMLALADMAPLDGGVGPSQPWHDITVLTASAPTPQFRATCRALNLTAEVRGHPTAVESGAVLWGEAAAGTIVEGLESPHAGFFEASADGIQGVGATVIEAIRHGGFGLSLTTASAFALDAATLFEAAVRRRVPVGRRESDGLIAVCLAETVANAVIHGNLGIGSGLRATREGFTQFREQINRGLADPDRAARRVELSLRPFAAGSFTIAVSDRGEGFDLDQRLAEPINIDAKHGRGLALIRKAARAVWAEDGGRTIVMAF